MFFRQSWLVLAAVAGGVVFPQSLPGQTLDGTEAQVAKIRQLVKPKQEAWRISQVAWQTDPWQAAVKAAQEGKPILTFGGHAGVSCGFC